MAEQNKLAQVTLYEEDGEIGIHFNLRDDVGKADSAKFLRLIMEQAADAAAQLEHDAMLESEAANG